ncbi:MAG: hypothetical protein ACOYMD_12685 [Paludibacter sp.]
MTVTARINIETPTGRRIVRELEKHKKVVQIIHEQPLGVDGLPRVTFPAEEVFDEMWDKLSELYGVDMRKI